MLPHLCNDQHISSSSRWWVAEYDCKYDGSLLATGSKIRGKIGDASKIEKDVYESALPSLDGR